MDDRDLGLSAEQTDKLLQFQELSGIEDISICRDVLQRHQWDLEVAIQEQLNIREGRPSVFATSTSESRAPTVVNDQTVQRVFSTPSAGSEPPQGIRGLFGYVVNLLMSFCYNTVSSVLSAIFSIFRSDDRRIVTDPLADVMSFIERYRDNYGAQPVFYQGTYAQAVSDAKLELRFLLVYLHSDNEPSTSEFCRNTLSNRLVSAYISSHMLLWGCNIQSPEGWRVAHGLSARRYPTCVVVALRENRMTVVGRVEGAPPANVFQQRLETLIGDNEIYLNQARADRYERSLTQTLRLQQDEAFAESLRVDQEKERIKEQERQAQRERENQDRQEELAEIQRKEDIARDKVECLARIPAEPPAGPEALSIVIKLPCGVRLERRFLAIHSIEDVFYYVFCHPSAPDAFEITTNFPKRVLQVDRSRSGSSLTLREAGLKNREVLFVNDLES